jgi:hypothetical protein
VDIRGHDIRAGHPDVLDAVPAPIARLPDIAGSRWGRHHHYHRSRWGKADHDPDAGDAGSGGERQRQATEDGKDKLSSHRKVPGKHLTSAKQVTDGDGPVLDGCQYVPGLYGPPDHQSMFRAVFTRSMHSGANGSVRLSDKLSWTLVVTQPEPLLKM